MPAATRIALMLITPLSAPDSDHTSRPFSGSWAVRRAAGPVPFSAKDTEFVTHGVGASLTSVTVTVTSRDAVLGPSEARTASW